MRLLGAALGATLVATFTSACGGGNPASQLAQAPGYDPKGQTRCSIEKSQAKPLIVEWPSADRGELEAQAHNRGLIVVRYSGCEMQVLDGCTTSVKYGYVPITRKKDRVVMRDADDLYANVPMGAARLEAKLQKSGELDVDMTMVGRWEAERRTVRADELQGSCDGATHVVSALTVGAFTFTAGADATVGGSATVLGAGGGALSTSKRETLNADGDESACEKSTSGDKLPPDGCGAMLRVEVVPLTDARAAALKPTCPDGTQWDGSQCVGSKVQCPTGTTWNGSQCVATVSTSCSAGMHFMTGQGCVPDVVAASPAPAPVEAPSTPPSHGLVVVSAREVVIKQPVVFAIDSAMIMPESFPMLQEVAAVLQKNATMSLEVQGHTDNSGTPEHNQVLSQLRAESVRDYLIRAHVDASRLTATGYGQNKPIVPNVTAASRARNRRIQLMIR